MQEDKAMALLSKGATLSSLLRATSELASSLVSDDERVLDLVRLLKLAESSSESLVEEMTTTLVESP